VGRSITFLKPWQGCGGEAPRQFIEQEPGPRGSPQEAQPPGNDLSDCPSALPTANADNCFSSEVLAQCGHDGAVELQTMVSKR
jgi:hypothetical protein